MASKAEMSRYDAERKQDLAYRLALAGATVQEIATSRDPETGDPLFQDGRGASAALAAARRRYRDEAEALTLDDEVAQAIARFDRVHRALWPKAIGGDVLAAREIRQIAMARAQLLRYDKGADVGPGKDSDTVDQLAQRREARRAANT